MLADLAIGEGLVKKADDGRRSKAIREIPAKKSRMMRRCDRLAL